MLKFGYLDKSISFIFLQLILDIKDTTTLSYHIDKERPPLHLLSTHIYIRYYKISFVNRPRQLFIYLFIYSFIYFTTQVQQKLHQKKEKKRNTHQCKITD